ncbi:MAG: ice-binding family protein [Bacillota bacterium]|nr:ice-binding family protein [Bacillota bacterium]
MLIIPLILLLLFVLMIITAMGIMAAQYTQTVELGTAKQFGVLAGSAISNTGLTEIKGTAGGNVGLSPTTGAEITGFPPGIVHGTIYTVDEFGPAGSVENPGLLTTAKNDLTTAYNDAASRPMNGSISANLDGQTFYPGVYNSGSEINLAVNGTVILDGQGNPNSVFIFQAGSTLITGSGSKVELINGAQPCHVFWQVGSSATLGVNSVFVGHILALTSITANTGAEVKGQLLARNGAVTLDDNTIINDLCMLADPAISVKKYVSIDGGVTWLDAQSAPGPSVGVDSEIQFKFEVTNTGNTLLTGINLTDTEFGDLSGQATAEDELASGASFEVIVDDIAEVGQHSNTATVTGYFDDEPYSDTDNAHYWGYVPVTDAPAISVKKYVSIDGGVTWHDADDPAGPSIVAGSEVQFKFVVTNTGNVELTDITLTDSEFGDLSGAAAVVDPLASGAFFEVIVDDINAEVGQHSNTATVTGYFDDEPYSDTDNAHYWGYVPVTDAPATSSLTVGKIISGDTGGITTLPLFEITVTGPEGFSSTRTFVGGETFTWTNLVPGTYSITELKTGLSDEWTVTGEGDVTVAADQTAVATVTNTYLAEVIPVGSLTVGKIISGDTGGITTLPLFEITVTGPEGFSSTRTFVGGETFTWTNLVPGTYSITELKTGLSDEWTVTGEGDVTVAADQTAVATVTNAYVTEEGVIDARRQLPRTGGNELLFAISVISLALAGGLLLKGYRRYKDNYNID